MITWPITCRPETPPYLQAAEAIRQAIAAGRLHAGEQLPPAHALEQLFGIAPMTLRSALRVLRELGLVYALQGRGTFVHATAAEAAAATVLNRQPAAQGTRAAITPVDWAELLRRMGRLEARLQTLEDRRAASPHGGASGPSAPERGADQH